MGFIKRLLGLEKKEEPTIQIDGVPEPVAVVISQHSCEKCGRQIPEGDVQTFGGKKFHKQCLRRLRKEAKRAAF